MVTIQQAKKLKHGQTLHHKTMRNADGTPMRARVTGKVQTWKTRPQEVKVPLKHGMYDTGYLTERTASEWSLTPPKTVSKSTKRSVNSAYKRMDAELRKYGL